MEETLEYTFDPHAPLAAEVRRVVQAQLDGAMAGLSSPDDDPEEAVHDARKRFKKVRAVLRLVRDTLGDDSFDLENTSYRDVGRRLSAARDAAVLVKTLDDLKVQVDDLLADEAFEPLRATLVQRYEAETHRLLEEEQVATEVAERLREMRPRIGAWPLDESGFALIRRGLKRYYKKGQKRMRTARTEPTVEALHEWRKRVKDHWYHVRLLERVWPALMDPWELALHDLADLLGDDHDLAVLRTALAEQPDLADEATRDLLVGLIDQRRAALQAAAWSLGARLYAETPDALAERLGTYWRVARSEPDGASEGSGW